MVKNPPTNAGDTDLIPGLVRAPGGKMATYAIILAWKNPMDKGAWWATALGISESDTTEHTHISIRLTWILSWFCHQ